MKTFKLLKLACVFALGTFLMYSCQQDSILDGQQEQNFEAKALQDVLSQNPHYVIQSSETTGLKKVTCETQVCIQFTADGNGLYGNYVVELPFLDPIVIKANYKASPVMMDVYANGIDDPKTDSFDPTQGPYCIDLTLTEGEDVPVTIRFKGGGSVVSTYTDANGNDCIIFDEGDATDDQVSVSTQEITIACECDGVVNPTTCNVEVCIDFTANASGLIGNYVVELPFLDNIVIKTNYKASPVMMDVYGDGIDDPITDSFNPNDGPYCIPLVLGINDIVPVTLRFKGGGEVETTFIDGDGDSCVVFNAGDASSSSVEIGTSDILISCDCP